MVDRVLIVLFIAVLVTIGYIAGTYQPSPLDQRLQGLEEIECDDIIRYTDNNKLVCEINLLTEDEELKIFRKER